MTTPWDRRENNFDFIRLALAVLVIGSHSYPLATGSEAAEPFVRMTHGQVTGGAIAVDLFFIMSGFLIAASAERSSSVWSFLGKRVRRIYPAFAVAMLVSAAVVLPLAGGHMVSGVLGFVGCTLRLTPFHYEGAFAGNPFSGEINGSVWSIPFEFWCYIGVALLTVGGLLRRRGAVLALFLAAVVVSVLFRVNGWILGGKALGVVFGYPVLWARLLPLYLAGVAFYLYRGRIRKRAWAMVAAVVALCAACFVPWGWTAAFPFAGTYLIFALAYTPMGRLHRFGRFGDLSYGTYLYAFPMEQMAMRWMGHAVAPGMLFAVATPVTLVAAAGSWYGVERWFLPRARKQEVPTPVLELVEAS
jgi:peptidoglycan/LPS O-acetylase OafA/YrhL